MKKLLVLLTVLAGTLTAHADGYPYLTFETTDGAKVSVPVEQLTIAISGNTLTVGTQTFVIANLAKMYFSATDESLTTGITQADKATLEQATEIYDLEGHKVPKAKMRRGAYIVKTRQGTHKIIVK